MRVYAIHRPIGPFTWPSQYRDKVVELVNFDCMTPIDELGGRRAFGYIDFSEDIPQEELYRYELVVPQKDDPMFGRVVGIIARHMQREQYDRVEHDLDLAKDKYGYDADRLMDAVLQVIEL